MRPMFLEFPADKRFETSETEFMFGPDLLIAPKVDEKFEPYEVTLPAGTWYDFWTGRDATSTKTLNPALDMLPVFVRGGAIIPEQPVVQSTGSVPQGPLEISVYPGPNCHGSLYQDDGNTLAYQRGEFLRMEFTCEAKPDVVSWAFTTTKANYEPWWNTMKITFFGFNREPREFLLDGKPVKDFEFDPANGSVGVEFPKTDQKQIEITK